MVISVLQWIQKRRNMIGNKNVTRCFLKIVFLTREFVTHPLGLLVNVAKFARIRLGYAIF